VVSVAVGDQGAAKHTRRPSWLFATATAQSEQATKESTTSTKPRFVIEKIGSSGGKNSFYRGDYINDKTYRDISSLCSSVFFGSSDEDEVLQRIRKSKQKQLLYKEIQPDSLRERKDNVKVATEYFVAYELKLATPEDIQEYRREQQLNRERQQRSSRRTNQQVPYNNHNNNYYYQVDHQSIKSPRHYHVEQQPFSQYQQSRQARTPTVVMGGNLGGIAGRHPKTRGNPVEKTNRPLKKYNGQQQQPRIDPLSGQYIYDGSSSTASTSPSSSVHGRDAFDNHRRGYVKGSGYDDYHDYDNYGDDDGYQDPYYNPRVTGGGQRIGKVGPSAKQRRPTSNYMGFRRGRSGPLYAHPPNNGRYHYNEFDYYQQPRSSSSSSGAGQGRNTETWGVEQPFMVNHDYNYNVAAARKERERQQLQQPSRQQQQRRTTTTTVSPKQRRQKQQQQQQQQPAHSYTSSDTINFDYQYIPNGGSPSSSQSQHLEHHHQQQVAATMPTEPLYEEAPPLNEAFYDQFRQRREEDFEDTTAAHYSHSEATGSIHEDEAPMYVKGPLVGFVEIVHTPYSLGVLDDPDMLQAGMKPHRPLLRNLVVAEHARNAGIGSRLLEACERHVQTHWQMNELVLEVDDLWSESSPPPSSPDIGSVDEQDTVAAAATSTPSAVEFYRKKGYEVVFSDPESKRYDEETGEVIGQIQCRRDVMRKLFGGDGDPTDVSSSKHEHSSNAYSPQTTKPMSGQDSYPKSPAKQVDIAATALDVEYFATESSDTTRVTNRDTSVSGTDDDSTPCTALETELITDPSEGPRSAATNRKSGTTVSCDPEGPNQSIFNSSSTGSSSSSRSSKFPFGWL
jgi:ribosomal protein S18 acetylase RimI-like enzyme